ncbi:MAG: GGDEF domain-containing protein [Clostridiales bacterium]|nr:GGDEF domain-containing protein [Clostridiales bacterium]
MFFNNRKTIGIFISNINNEYQEFLCEGISRRAQELGYNAIFFTSFGGYAQDEYEGGENHITEIPNYEDLDGIIIATDTLIIEGLEQRIRDNIKERSNCPVVSIREKVDDYYNVLIDNNKVLEEVIRHFIEVHGFTKLNFLAGPEDHFDSQIRLESYKRVLTEYGIPIEEDRIYYGDFWKRMGVDAVEYWLSNSHTKPQAIICANDYMAITVVEELGRRGIAVPDEIAVSGCDDAIDSSEYVLGITTVNTPIDKMGIEAVDKIDRINKGHMEEQNSYIETKTIYRKSCGCNKDYSKEINVRKEYYYKVINELTREVTRNAYMSADFAGITKRSELHSKLRYYVYENRGFTDFYMCMYRDWQTINEDEAFNRDNIEEMVMEVGIKNRQDYSKIRFSKKYLIPPQFSDDKPMIYYVALLHHQFLNFGYVAIAYDRIQTYMKTFQAWLINVSNVLENIRIHNELNRLVYKLEDMYIRDELTGLYNRRGLGSLGENYLNQAMEKQVNLMILSADLDELKKINDNYGHAGGDIALKVLAEALTFVADDDEICARFGGDEFLVIGLEYDEAKANRFVKRFIDKVNAFNQSVKEEFNVYVSYGWILCAPNEETTLEECLAKADFKMYQQKKQKRSLRLRANLLQ